MFEKLNIFDLRCRAAGRSRFFLSATDYLDFEGAVVAARRRWDVETFGYCLLQGMWRLQAAAPDDATLRGFAEELTQDSETRHLSAQPLRSPVAFRAASSATEQAPLRAGLVDRAEHWRWSSLWVRLFAPSPYRDALLSPWPLPVPVSWTADVNRLHHDFLAGHEAI